MLKKLRIRYKILIGIFFLLMLRLPLDFYILNRMNVVTQDFRTFSNLSFQKIRTLTEMKYESSQTQAITDKLYLLGNNSPTKNPENINANNKASITTSSSGTASPNVPIIFGDGTSNQKDTAKSELLASLASLGIWHNQYLETISDKDARINEEHLFEKTKTNIINTSLQLIDLNKNNINEVNALKSKLSALMVGLVNHINNLVFASKTKFDYEQDLVLYKAERLQRIELFLDLFVMLIGIILSFVIAQIISNPIARIAKFATKVSGKATLANENVPLTSSDEVYQLEFIIKDMVEKLKNSDELKRSKEELEKALILAESANQAKSTFLANISHELRTPLNAIIGLSELLVEEIREEKDQSYLEPMSRIFNAGKHLLSLINNILDLSKIESGKMELFIEDFSIKEVLNDVFVVSESLAKKNNNKLIFDYPDDIGNLRSDMTKLKQIIINLISNACKFTKDGQVTLNVIETMENSTSWLKFSVTDTGIGISDTQIGKLFDKFVQADSSTTKKFGGTGLGLVITKTICELMGGNIVIASELGKGTTLTVNLPRNRQVEEKEEVLQVVKKDLSEQSAKEVSQQPSSVSGSIKKSNIKILVIEDNETERNLIEKYLLASGYSVIFAINGEDGLKLALSEHPDIILLDILLPGLSGWDVLQTLKNDAEACKISIIVISILEEKNKAYFMGASDYLVKPFNQTKLLDTLSRYVITNSSEPNDLGRVLIVDDDDNARLFVKKIVSKFKAFIDEAPNGVEAIKNIIKHQPNLIILDLMMPIMDGFEVIETLKKSETWSGIPVVINTAKDLDENDYKKITGSVTKILYKSEYTPNDLFNEINLIVSKINSDRSVGLIKNKR